MESQAEGEVLCMANPPVPIVTIQGLKKAKLKNKTPNLQKFWSQT